jgi:1-acyl-sn-glycerol-3-phosphate acyltransferase
MSRHRRSFYLALSLWFHFWQVFLGFFFSLGAIFMTFLDPSRRLAHRIPRCWSHILLHLARCPVTVEGLEHLHPGENYVFAANHRSAFDIYAVLVAIPRQFLFVAKSSLFQIPLFGQALARMGYVAIERGKRQEAIRSLNEAVAKVQAGANLLIYPEGTRARSRELLPFKKGVFIMAMRAGRPVVPVVINGTMIAQPPGSFLIRPNPIQVIFCPPVSPRDFRRKEDLMEAVRQAIAARFKPDYPYAPGTVRT